MKKFVVYHELVYLTQDINCELKNKKEVIIVNSKNEAERLCDVLYNLNGGVSGRHIYFYEEIDSD